jgi:hypothetical protein
MTTAPSLSVAGRVGLKSGNYIAARMSKNIDPTQDPTPLFSLWPFQNPKTHEQN